MYLPLTSLRSNSDSDLCITIYGSKILTGEIQNIGKVHLRHEAEALKLDSLSISQINAFSELSALLLEALNASGGQRTQAVSRIAILSGQKGTGKSSVMLTMQELMSHPSRFRHEIGRLKKENTVNHEQFGYLEKLIDKDHNDLLQKVHWLPAMSMDPWPEGSSFLGGVFARLDTVIGSMAMDTQERNRFDRDGTLSTNTARQWFLNLRNEAVIALEGNISKIGTSMEPELYAKLVNETEDHKVQMDVDLENILSSIISPNNNDPTDDKGIFVVVIDDVDLRPAQAAKALKLAHSMANSRLFFLFLGDIEALDNMLFYEVQGEFVSLLEHPPTKIEMEDIEARSNEIASSVVRKLIPWNQRIRISDMTIDEALDYTMNTGISADDNRSAQNQVADNTLKTILHKLPIYRNYLHSHDSRFSNKAFNEALASVNSNESLDDAQLSRLVTNFARSISFYNFFESPILFGNAGNDRVAFYDGANILAVAPRHVGDFFHAMEALLPMSRPSDANVKLSGSSEDADRLIEALNSTFRSFINEDGYLTVPVQEHLKSMLEKHSRWELNPLKLLNQPIIGDSFELMHDKKGDEIKAVIGVRPYFKISKIIRNDIEYERNSGKNVRLNSRSRPALKILHDFLKFTGEGVIVSSVKSPNLERHMSTNWRISEHDQLQVPWKISEWPTYWHQDLYGAIWNNFFDCITDIQRQPSEVSSEDLNKFFIYGWISSTMTVLNAQPGLIVQFSDESQESNNCKTPRFSFSGKQDDNTIDFLFDQIIHVNGDNPGKIILDKLSPTKPFDNITEDTQFSLIYKFALILDRLFRRVIKGEEDEFTRTLQTKICEIICLASPEIGVFLDVDLEKHTVSSCSIKDNLFSEIFELINDPIKYHKEKLSKIDKTGRIFNAISLGDNDENRHAIESIIYDIWSEVADIRLHRLADHIGIPLVFEMACSFAGTENSKKFNICSHDLNIDGQNPTRLNDKEKLNAIPTTQQLRNAITDWISFCPKTLVNQLGLHYCSKRLFSADEHEIISQYNERRFQFDD